MRFNLLDFADLPIDYSGSRVRVPLSGGINSAAVLCALGEHHPDNLKPLELFLYYSHLKEHSPDTFAFVADLIRYARRRFLRVTVRITRNSVNKFFLEENMIPHPTISPCSMKLKVEPMQEYDKENQIDYVLIGFVSHEFRRYKRAMRYANEAQRTKDRYPILHWTDENCFDLVRSVIGWYPAIYDIRWTKEDAAQGFCRSHEIGKRVFPHNNCLYCKNMSARQVACVDRFYPEYAARAQATAAKIPGAYWGRDDVPEVMKCDVCERM